MLENLTGDLVTQFLYEQDDQFPAFRYEVRFTNKGDTPIGGLKVRPFSLRFAVSPPLVLPRVRYLTGSQHYDATYPSRAFEVVDRAWMTPDHAKPIEIGGKLSGAQGRGRLVAGHEFRAGRVDRTCRRWIPARHAAAVGRGMDPKVGPFEQPLTSHRA